MYQSLNAVIRPRRWGSCQFSRFNVSTADEVVLLSKLKVIFLNSLCLLMEQPPPLTIKHQTPTDTLESPYSIKKNQKLTFEDSFNRGLIDVYLWGVINS